MYAWTVCTSLKTASKWIAISFLGQPILYQWIEAVLDELQKHEAAALDEDEAISAQVLAATLEQIESQNKVLTHNFYFHSFDSKMVLLFV